MFRGVGSSNIATKMEMFFLFLPVVDNINFPKMWLKTVGRKYIGLRFKAKSWQFAIFSSIKRRFGDRAICPTRNSLVFSSTTPVINYQPFPVSASKVNLISLETERHISNPSTRTSFVRNYVTEIVGKTLELKGTLKKRI